MLIQNILDLKDIETTILRYNQERVHCVSNQRPLKYEVTVYKPDEVYSQWPLIRISVPQFGSVSGYCLQSAGS